MYDMFVKHKDLIKILKQNGWYLKRQGGEHEIWTNGEHNVPVPRHKEINEFTAKGIIRKVKNNPVKK